MKRAELLMFIIVLLCSLCGCASSTAEQTATGQRLFLSLQPDDDVGFVNISAQELGESYTDGITYCWCSAAQIHLPDGWIDLICAIRQNAITPEEIVAFAQIDARNGFCEMKYQSELGYAHYAYCYEDFDVVCVYDVYEAPDGSLYPLKELVIGTAGFYDDSAFGAPYVEIDGERVCLAQEDWNIVFHVVDASPDGVTVRYVLGKGQYIGNLRITGYELLAAPNEDGRKMYTRAADEKARTHISVDLHQGTGEFTIDWYSLYGSLPEGQNSIRLYIEDIYDDIPELMKNYTDKQSYEIQLK